MRLASVTIAAIFSLALFVAAAPAAAVTTFALTTTDAPSFRSVTGADTTVATATRDHSLLLAAKSRINAKQAAATVKQKLGGKVLSVKLIESKGPPVYRIKTLSESGVVKVVFVDGLSGKLFD